MKYLLTMFLSFIMFATLGTSILYFTLYYFIVIDPLYDGTIAAIGSFIGLCMWINVLLYLESKRNGV